MKQNDKKNADKNNRNAKGGSKTNLRHARAARAKNAAVLEKPKMPGAQKLFIALIALICVFAILLASLGTVLLVDVMGQVKYGSIYDKVDLGKYVKNIKKADYTGQDIDLSSYYQAPYVLADMDDYLTSLAMQNRKLTAASQMASVIGYGDDVAYYVIGVSDKDGNAILKDDFAAADYQTPLTMTVGSAVFGADFDEKLIALGITPDATERSVRYNGTVNATDVISLTYQAYACEKNDSSQTDPALKYDWATKAGKTFAGGRVDLSDYDARIAEAIAANCLAVQEPFSFILENYDLDGNGTIEGKETAVKFEVTVNFVVTREKTADITFTLPENYFAETDGATLVANNGKNVTLHIIFARADDYEVPAINASFIKDTLKFETDKTADADVIAAFKEYSLEKLNKEREKSMQQNYYSAVISALVAPLYQNGYFGDKGASSSSQYPQELIKDAFDRAYRDLESLYYSSGYSSSMTFENYAVQYVYSQTGMQAQNLSNALSYMAEQMIVQELFLYCVLDQEGLKITDEMLDAAYREYVDNLVSSSSDPAVYNEEYFVKQYGKDELYSRARRSILVYRTVGDFLLANNNITYGK